eukprot:Selendium_serpulae@DN403_c0_g1_i2.p3
MGTDKHDDTRRPSARSAHTEPPASQNTDANAQRQSVDEEARGLAKRQHEEEEEEKVTRRSSRRRDSDEADQFIVVGSSGLMRQMTAKELQRDHSPPALGRLPTMPKAKTKAKPKIKSKMSGKDRVWMGLAPRPASNK